jgi:RHS repeat-associated core domain
MAGDKVDIWGKSYYLQNNAGGNNYNVPLLGILDGFLNAPSGVAGGKTTSAELNGLTVLTSALSNFLSDPDRNNGGASTVPKAYINYILLDENFRYKGGGFSRVDENPNVVKDHYLVDASVQNIQVTQNGYIYVYVSNESPVEVFFDNLQVIHTRGPVLEETHYYPFGLTIAGISSKAMSKIENKFRFNFGSELQNNEFSDGSGFDIYETPFRNYDPQIGRFNQIDPLSVFNQSSSPFSFVENNPILFIDPLGLDTFRVTGKVPKGTPSNSMIIVETPTGGTSYYIYRPGDPNADEDGLIPVGMVNAPEATIVVTPNGNRTEENEDQQGNGSANGNVTEDPVNNRRILTLDPRVQGPAADFINRVQNELGIRLRVAQALRTLEEQNNLYAQGRTRPGPIVTNARGGQSYHNFGLAIDVYMMDKNGRVDFNQVVPPAVVEIARQEGFEWGGNWRSFRDNPHFQLTLGQTLQQLRLQHGIH